MLDKYVVLCANYTIEALMVQSRPGLSVDVERIYNDDTVRVLVLNDTHYQYFTLAVEFIADMMGTGRYSNCSQAIELGVMRAIKHLDSEGRNANHV